MDSGLGLWRRLWAAQNSLQPVHVVSSLLDEVCEFTDRVENHHEGITQMLIDSLPNKSEDI